MSSRIDRILTTHVGSLPRSQAVTDVVFARETRQRRRDAPRMMPSSPPQSPKWCSQQVEVGIDFVSDGEMSKISYATYIADRFSGFDGDSPREPGQDLVEFPRAAAASSPSAAPRPSTAGRAASAGSAVKNLRPLQSDIAQPQRGRRRRRARTSAFMNAASPGVIALFQPNDFYPTQDAYLEALADGDGARNTRPSSRAGIILQIDAPDLAMGRHTMYRDRTLRGVRRRSPRGTSRC